MKKLKSFSVFREFIGLIFPILAYIAWSKGLTIDLTKNVIKIISERRFKLNQLKILYYNFAVNKTKHVQYFIQIYKECNLLFCMDNEVHRHK